MSENTTGLILPTSADVEAISKDPNAGLTSVPSSMQIEASGLVGLNGRKSSDLTNEERLELVLEGFNQDFIPVPVGWRILIAPPKIASHYKSGLVKTDTTMKGERYQGSYGYLVAVGEGYNRHKVTGDAWKFSNARPGELVIHGKWSGQVMKVTDDVGEERFFHVLNDDEILAICHPDSEVMTATAEMLNNLM